MALLSLSSLHWRDPSSWGYLAGFLFLLYITSAVWAWYPLRHIPGPRLASFSYLWKARNHLERRCKPAFIGLKKYGSVVRVAPNYVLTDDPEVLRKVAGVRSKYTRDSWNTAGKISELDNMVTTTDVLEHDRIKSMVINGYNGRENPDLEGAIDSQVIRLLDLIRRKYLSTKGGFQPLDFAPLSRYFTLDVITRLMYGKPFGHLDEGTDVYGMIEQIDIAAKVMGITLDLPFVRAICFSPFVLSLLGPKPTDKKGIGKAMSVASEFIDQRLKEDIKNKSKQDMLGTFVQNGLTRIECEGEAMLALFAGSETSASVIRGTIFLLMRSPRVYSRLKYEIRKYLDLSEASYPITYNQSKDIPYLQAVIWEGFRLHVPFTHGHYKSVPPGGDTVNGIYLPGGTAIGHNAVALVRNEAIFGNDVETFRPERFLDCEESQRIQMERALDILFGGGRWTCAGKTVAMMELNKVFFELMRNFDLEFVYPEKPWVEQSYLTPHHRDMWVTVTEALL